MLAVSRGRTELQLPECSAPLLQGWSVQATGVLRRPLPASHPLLPGSAERLARQASWSQLRVESIELLQRPWTPLADLRRDVSQWLQQVVGPRQGGFFAALVPSSAQVQLPVDIREASAWPAGPMPMRSQGLTSPFARQWVDACPADGACR